MATLNNEPADEAGLLPIQAAATLLNDFIEGGGLPKPSAYVSPQAMQAALAIANLSIALRSLAELTSKQAGMMHRACAIADRIRLTADDLHQLTSSLRVLTAAGLNRDSHVESGGTSMPNADPWANFYESNRDVAERIQDLWAELVDDKPPNE